MPAFPGLGVGSKVVRAIERLCGGRVNRLQHDQVSVCLCAAFPGDHVAGMLAVAVASSRTLEVLDLEGTGLTNQSAQVRTLCVWGWARI